MYYIRFSLSNGLDKLYVEEWYSTFPSTWLHVVVVVAAAHVAVVYPQLDVFHVFVFFILLLMMSISKRY